VLIKDEADFASRVGGVDLVLYFLKLSSELDEQELSLTGVEHKKICHGTSSPVAFVNHENIMDSEHCIIIAWNGNRNVFLIASRTAKASYRTYIA